MIGQSCTEVKQITLRALGGEGDTVDQLTVHNDGAGIASVEGIRLLTAEGVQNFREIMDRCILGTSRFEVGSHHQIVQWTHLAQSGTGIVIIDFAQNIILGFAADTVID